MQLTEDQRNKLATEILGWKIKDRSCFFDQDNQQVEIISDWQPDLNIAQALLVAERIGDLCIVRNDVQTIVMFSGNVCIQRIGNMEAFSLAAVISEAAVAWLQKMQAAMAK